MIIDNTQRTLFDESLIYTSANVQVNGNLMEVSRA